VVFLNNVEMARTERCSEFFESGEVWYRVWEVPQMLLFGFTKEKHSKARPTQKRYYTTRVVRH